MIGSRVGSQTVLIGSVLSSSADDEGGWAPVAAGPGLVMFIGSSGAQGVGIAANMTDYPGIGNAFAGFQLLKKAVRASR